MSLDSTMKCELKIDFINLPVCKKKLEENRIMYLSELVVSRCRQWMGNREFVWSGLGNACTGMF